MPLDDKHTDLPIASVITELKQKLKDNNTLVLNASPGAGKSTYLPITLLDEPWLKGKKILLLEPRRLAVQTIAARLASLLNESVGQTVGYRIRLESKISQQTQLEVITEGILTRRLLQDNALEDVGLVIFDEFHERNIHSDVALALCREAQQILRPDLRILVMSATLNMPELCALLQAPSVVCEGRQYPVEIKYLQAPDLSVLSDYTAQITQQAAQEQKGDILVFLPGEADIKRTQDILQRSLPDFAIHPLYGMLPPQEQFRAIFPHPQGKRKVVLATSIAETSLTIEGVTAVVDSGFGKRQVFDPKTSLSSLETLRITQDAATQRAGRAGRLGPGVCYRLWNAAIQAQMPQHRVAEIQEADLSPLMLDLARWGIDNAYELSWLTPPPKLAAARAQSLLQSLGALEGTKITSHGQKMQSLACHPRMAHMLIKAQDLNLLPLATDIAALLEERDPMPRDTGIDLNLRIEALRRQRINAKWARPFQRIEQLSQYYRRLFQIEATTDSVDPYQTGLLLAYAYPERIACAKPGNNAPFQMASGKLASAGHQDALAHESWLAIAHVDDRPNMGKIFLASPLNPQDLKPLLKKHAVLTWNAKKGGLLAQEELRLGSIVLQIKPMLNPSEDACVQAISEALLKDGAHLLDFNEAFTQWQNRILSAKEWYPLLEFPDVSTQALLQSNATWLGPYLGKVRTPADLKKLPLAEILQHALTYDQQQQLQSIAPEHIQVPSGSNISLQYSAKGEAPILAVRLQEVFGMEQTPRVNQGKIPVLMHLLSPGYKLVQITSDLQSFWNKGYFDVKKDLARRYPKHAWPEDPWVEKAIAGAKKRK